MHWIDNDEDDNIPKGKAMLWVNNNGWVGTNNGYPMTGQPALFPRSQAVAITQAMNFVSFLGEEKVKELLPNPDGMQPEFYQWLFNNITHDHNK